jgi:hypothetical protein
MFQFNLTLVPSNSVANTADLGTVGLQALEACALRLANTADLGTVGLEALEACALRLANTADLGT